MTSPLRKKHPTTPPSTRRRSPSETAARCIVCLALAALLVCVPGGEKSTYAGKKRREASLDRLRDRSPSERWKSLQRTWQPFAGEQDSPQSPAPGDTQADATSAGETGTDAADAGSEVPRNDGFTPAAGSQPAERFSVRPAPPANEVPVLQTPVPQTAVRSAKTPSPVWVIDSDANQSSTDLKRPVGDTIVTSLQADEGPLSPSQAMERRMAESATLKPITEILPYHDYIPSGTTDPDDLLCLDGDDTADCPQVDELPEIGFEERLFAETYVAWEPSNLFSNPLYFEDASLERYGHTHGCLQPLFSLGKFSAQLVGLPYQMALHPIHERRYALGWYRPGECAPHKYYLPPWNTKAALTAGAAYTGLFFLIP